jgi:cytochrome c5
MLSGLNCCRLWRMLLIRAAALVLCASVCVASAHATSLKRVREAGQVGPPAKPVAEGPGKEILTRKCFQCHQVGMWSSLRQDRKEWESVIYRMVGRGALWTEAEINAMVDFLAQTRGQ